jgi:predicted HicB family RNase H-like nuclease
MPKPETPISKVAWVQLATRIPKRLHRDLKEYSVVNDVSMMEVVVEALQDKLREKPKKTHLKVVQRQKESA